MSGQEENGGRQQVQRASRKRVGAGVAALCALVLLAIAVFAMQAPSPGVVAQPSAATQKAESQAAPSASSEASSSASVADSADSASQAPSTAIETPSRVVASGEDDPNIQAEHVQGVVLVQLADGATVDEVNAALSQASCVKPQSATAEDISLGFMELQLADGVSLSQAMQQLETLSVVESSQPNYIYHAQDAADATPSLRLAAIAQVSDPKASSQWALDSMNVYGAWKIAKAGDVGNDRVTVAVIDNGCLVTHEDLKNNIVATYNANSDVTDKTDVTPHNASGIYSHGTHVCGIVAAEANNAKGVAGVSYNAGILPIQAFSTFKSSSSSTTTSAGITTSALRNSYSYIMDHASEYNIRVVNISAGLTATASYSADQLLVKSVKNAYEQGIVTVCAAGNEADEEDGPYYNYPSDWLDCAVGVIALQKGAKGQAPSRAAYSNYNVPNQKTKDISAPGSGVLSTLTTSTSAYGEMNGTSMATPCVSGVLALIFAENSGLSAQQAIDAICNTATDLGDEGWDEEYGAGEVDAEAAVKQACKLAGNSDYLYIEGNTKVLVGNKLQLAASVEDACTWKSSNEAVAKVSSSGLVTGVSAGSATITVNDGTVSSSETITVYEGSFAEIDDGPDVGSTVELQFSASPDVSSWAFSSSDDAVASVTGTSMDGGVVTVTVKGVSAGNASIVASLSSDAAQKVECPLTVYGTGDERPISNATISIENDTFYYTGSAIKPAIDVTYRAGSRATHLVEGSDYVVRCADNVDVGTAAYTVKGINSFAGEVSGTFAIEKCPVDLVSHSWPKTYVYTGTAQTPVPTVTRNGTTYELQAGKDFDIDLYENNVDAGTAQAAITMKGNFAGSITVEFDIEQVDFAQATATMKGWMYDGTAHKPDVTVKLAGRTLDADEYQVSYTNNKNAGTCTATIAPTDTKNCTGFTEATCTVAKRSVTLTSPSASKIYDGTPLTAPSVTSSGSGFVSGQISRVYARGSITNVGTAVNPIAIVRGNGYSAANYSITYKKGVLSVNPASIANAQIAPIANQTYTGGVIFPVVSVYMNGTTLRKGVDYTYTCTNSVNVGTAFVTVRGIGNYTGTKIARFSIVAPDGTTSSATSSAGSTTTASTAATVTAATAATAAKATPTISYRTYVKKYKWQKYVKNGATSGKVGKKQPVEAIRVKLANKPYSGGVKYRTYVSKHGWQKYVKNGAKSNKVGKGWRSEIVRIKLTGNMAKHYDVYYRVYTQKFKWMGWAKNGTKAGTSGYGYRIEGLQVKLVPKGSKAPGSTKKAYCSK